MARTAGQRVLRWAALLAALLAAGAVVAGRADAMTFFRAAASDGRPVVLAYGTIGIGDAERFEALLRQIPKAASPVTVSVDSEGGNVLEAISLGTAVQERGLPVAVLGEHVCYSACFFLFAAAPTKLVGQHASIGVHRASNHGQESFGSYLASGVSAMVIRSWNVPDEILGKLLRTPSADLAILSAADLRTMGATVLDDTRSQPLLATAIGGGRPKQGAGAGEGTAVRRH